METRQAIFLASSVSRVSALGKRGFEIKQTDPFGCFTLMRTIDETIVRISRSSQPFAIAASRNSGPPRQRIQERFHPRFPVAACRPANQQNFMQERVLVDRIYTFLDSLPA